MRDDAESADTEIVRFDYERVTVGDAMRDEVIYCAPDTSPRGVARIMAQDRIHCVLIGGVADWSVVTDLDLIRAVDRDIDHLSAAEIAAGELPTVDVGEPLERARALMVEHEVTHVLVLDAGSGRPVGVLSALDIAAILA
jgi:CBS domain-containing protein